MASLPAVYTPSFDQVAPSTCAFRFTGPLKNTLLFVVPIPTSPPKYAMVPEVILAPTLRLFATFKLLKVLIPETVLKF